MILFLVRILILILIFFICAYFYRSRDVKADYLKFRKKTIESILSNSDRSVTYLGTYSYLLSHGATFYVGTWVTPFDYVLCRILLAIAFLLFGLIFHPVAGLLFAVLGFALPKLLLDLKNKDDNASMLDELAQVYATVSLQVKSGVWIGNALHECYLITRQPRLKQALWELSKEVESSIDLSKAAEHFREKFENSYIDTFSKSLEQSLQTGNAAKNFSDISKQLNSINDAIYKKEEGHVNSMMTVSITLVFLAGIIGIAFVLLSVGVDNLFGIF